MPVWSIDWEDCKHRVEEGGGAARSSGQGAECQEPLQAVKEETQQGDAKEEGEGGETAGEITFTPEEVDDDLRELQVKLQKNGPPFLYETFAQYPVTRNPRWISGALKWYRKFCRGNGMECIHLPNKETNIPWCHHYQGTDYDFFLDETMPWCWMEMVAGLRDEDMKELVADGILGCSVSISAESYDHKQSVADNDYEKKNGKKKQNQTPQSRGQGKLLEYDFTIHRKHGIAPFVRLHPSWNGTNVRRYLFIRHEDDVVPPETPGTSSYKGCFKYYLNTGKVADLRFDRNRITKNGPQYMARMNNAIARMKRRNCASNVGGHDPQAEPATAAPPRTPR